MNEVHVHKKGKKNFAALYNVDAKLWTWVGARARECVCDGVCDTGHVWARGEETKWWGGRHLCKKGKKNFAALYNEVSGHGVTWGSRYEGLRKKGPQGQGRKKGIFFLTARAHQWRVQQKNFLRRVRSRLFFKIDTRTQKFWRARGARKRPFLGVKKGPKKGRKNAVFGGSPKIMIGTIWSQKPQKTRFWPYSRSLPVLFEKSAKNPVFWRFLTFFGLFRKPSKMALFWPILNISKNDDFFVINDAQQQNFWRKSPSRKKSGTSFLGRGRGGSPLIFSWKSSRWYL
jgi:hypothetical protein